MPKRTKSEIEDAETSSPKKAKGETTEFTADHQLILARAIEKLVMANRTALYTTPGLEPFRGHGSSKLSAKVQHLMDVFDKANGGDGSVAKVFAKGAKTGQGK